MPPTVGDVAAAELHWSTFTGTFNMVMLIVILVRVRWLVYGLRAKEGLADKKAAEERTKAEINAFKAAEKAAKKSKDAGGLWMDPDDRRSPTEHSALFASSKDLESYGGD